MAKRQFSKFPARSIGLFTLACSLLVLSFPMESTKAIWPAMTAVQTASSSPTPMPKKQPKPVRRKRRKPTPISDPPNVVVTSSLSSIAVCRVTHHSAHDCPTDSAVELSATAGIPALDARLLFTWNVTGGRLRGEGRKVVWDLSGLADGTYTAEVEVNDGHQHTAYGATKVTVTQCSDCVYWESPCPTISVSCPSAVDLKEPIVFEATVSGGFYEEKLIYTWSVKGGKIISGQGTSKITVHATRVGETVTAVITLGGIDPRCISAGIRTASCRVDEVR